MLNWINGIGKWIDGFWTATRFWWGGGAKKIEDALAFNRRAVTALAIIYVAYLILLKVIKRAKEKKAGSR